MSFARSRRVADTVLQAQFFVEGAGRLDGCLRVLETVSRGVQRLEGDRYVFVDRLVADGNEHLPWQERRFREVPLELVLEDGAASHIAFQDPELIEEQPIEEGGVRVGRLLCVRRALRGLVQIAVERASAVPRNLYRVTLRVESLGPAVIVLPEHDALACR